MLLLNWINRTHNQNKAFAVDKTKARWFSAILLLAILCLAYFMSSFSLIYSFFLGGYIVVSLFLPILIWPILYPWMWIGSIMSEIISFTFLSIVYYLILTPVSFFLKKKDYKPGWKPKESFSSKDKLY